MSQLASPCYAVIFRARIAQLDDDYTAMAKALRERAFSQYGCLGFSAACEAGEEIAISYWPSLQAIQRWQQDPLHLQAQQLGRERWYQHYSVEVAQVERRYSTENT